MESMEGWDYARACKMVLASVGLSPRMRAGPIHVGVLSLNPWCRAFQPQKVFFPKAQAKPAASKAIAGGRLEHLQLCVFWFCLGMVFLQSPVSKNTEMSDWGQKLSVLETTNVLCSPDVRPEGQGHWQTCAKKSATKYKLEPGQAKSRKFPRKSETNRSTYRNAARGGFCVSFVTSFSPEAPFPPLSWHIFLLTALNSMKKLFWQPPCHRGFSGC